MSRFDTVIHHAEKQIKFQEGTRIPAEIYWLIIRHTPYYQQICGAFSHQALGYWLPKFMEETWPHV